MSQKINEQELKWLIGTSASDINFKTTLDKANQATILAALEHIDGQEGQKTRVKALRIQLSKLSKQNMDDATEAAEQVIQMERLQEVAVETEQKTREKLIAQCHEHIGRIQGFELIKNFTTVGSLVWLKQVKESKVYRDVPGIGSWDKFCDSIGLSRSKVDEDLLNLATFGESFLANVGAFSLGYRDLKKLRQLTHDGALSVEGKTVVIGGESIPLDNNHSEELQIAFDNLLDEKNRQLDEAKATLKAKDRIIDSKEQVINKQEREIAKHENRAEKQGMKPGEEAFLAEIENDRVVVDGILRKYEVDPDRLRDDLTPRMKAATLEFLGYIRSIAHANLESGRDMLCMTEDLEPWDPDAEIAQFEAEQKKPNLRSL